MLWLCTFVITHVCLPEPFFVTRLLKGGGVVVTTPPSIFAVKPPILMILALADMYASPLSIDIKKRSSPSFDV